MTKHEIDEMMRDLPSQRDWYATNWWDEALAGLAFVAFVVMICLL
jgi:hypothetical protein